MMNCHDIENIIEPYVDGDLEPGIRQQVEEHIARCQDCEAKLTLAVRIHDGLGALPKVTCPDSVVQTVSARIERERKGWLGGIKPAWRIFRRRYAVGFAVGVAIIAVTIMTANRYSPSRWFHDEPPQYTQQEIALARQNILLAFGYVHYATNRTQQVIEEDILPRRVVRPFQKSLDHLHLNREKGESS